MHLKTFKVLQPQKKSISDEEPVKEFAFSSSWRDWIILTAMTTSKPACRRTWTLFFLPASLCLKDFTCRTGSSTSVALSGPASIFNRTGCWYEPLNQRRPRWDCFDLSIAFNLKGNWWPSIDLALFNWDCAGIDRGCPGESWVTACLAFTRGLAPAGRRSSMSSRLVPFTGLLDGRESWKHGVLKYSALMKANF